MQEPSEEFDPNDTGEPVNGMEPNDGTNLEDVLGQAWDKAHEGDPEPGDEPGNAGCGVALKIDPLRGVIRVQ
ncbi:MAG: hypothetical protein F4X97_04025, partial [Boseongicola sp. SB0662_bin_57]|nr:hypothetical protein [Boseongicola sp. SB0662_bin_57]